MKIREKTTATILIALFVISAFATITAVSGSYIEQEDGKGQVELSTEDSVSGIHSMKLILPAPIVNEDEARVKFSYDDTLDSLTEISFDFKLVQTYGVWQAFPYMTFSMDMNDDGEADAWGVTGVWEWIGAVPGVLDTWYTYDFTDTSLVAVTGVKTGGDPPPWYVPPLGIPFSELKTTFQPDLITPWGECTVLEFKFGTGNCGDNVPVEDTVIAFVDDVMINELFYDFEPEPVLILSPNEGISMFSLYGEYFTPNTAITLTWDGDPLFGEIPVDIWSDSEGTFLDPAMVLTQDDPGSHELIATDSEGLSASATFTVSDMTGPTGPPGPEGPEGPEGDRGPRGSTGPIGPTGIEGPEGEIGLQGETGPQGPTGNATIVQGEPGLQGETGSQGETGPAGIQGIQGELGPPGEQGLTGDQGLIGLQGLTGATGPQGVPAPAGISWLGMGTGVVGLIVALYVFYLKK